MDMVISVTKHLPGPSPTLWGPLKSSQSVLPSFGVERTNVGGGGVGGNARGLYPLHSGLVEPWS